MAKKKTEDTINLDSILFKCRDILRAARNSGSFFEKRDMMLTLVFLRFIGEKYEDGIEKLRQILIEQGLDPDDENIRAAFFDDATFADGTYNLPPEARWSTIINTPAPKLNVALDNALHSIAAGSKQLKGCFVEGTFTTRNLAANDIKKLIDEVNKISHKQFGEEKDLIGRVYEYFLKEFAVNATKEEGEFYTPHDAVQLIATMIEPYDGTLYDPCCGSGGMFIQSAALVKSKQGDINRINVYGQEKEPATYRLAKMNLALRGISHNLGETSDSSFLNDLHKGLYFDYIMANPPFNVDEVSFDRVSGDARFNTYGVPRNSTKSAKKASDKKETVPNANYLWIGYFATALNEHGKAALVMANSASDAGKSEYEIRKKMIEEGIISQMVTLPSNMFSSVTLPATLWFFDKHKPQTDKKNEILFIDARNVFTQVDRAHRKFSDEQIKNLGIITRLYHGDTAAFVALLVEYREALAAAPEAAEDKETKTKAYWQAQIDWLTERFPDGEYRDVIGLCKAAKLDGEDGIIDQDYSLNAGRYVGVVIEDDGMTEADFKETMLGLNAEFEALNEEAKKLEAQISLNLRGLFTNE